MEVIYKCVFICFSMKCFSKINCRFFPDCSKNTCRCVFLTHYTFSQIYFYYYFVIGMQFFPFFLDDDVTINRFAFKKINQVLIKNKNDFYTIFIIKNNFAGSSCKAFVFSQSWEYLNGYSATC